MFRNITKRNRGFTQHSTFFGMPKKLSAGFTPTPILASLRSFFSILLKKFKNIKRFNICGSLGLQQKTMPKMVSGFTLIELLTTVAIISLLLSVVMSSLNNAKQRARDTQRISDMKQIQIALELYYTDNGRYPSTTDNDCSSGWDYGNEGVGDTFILQLEAGGHMGKILGDPMSGVGGSCTYFYGYQRFDAGDFGCDVSKGAFYVLGVYDMEVGGIPHSDSPGFTCPLQDFEGPSGMYDWVDGKFESDQL